MDNVSAGMQALCEEIVAGYGARKIALVFIKDEARALRGDVKLFVGQCRILRHQTAKKMRKELTEYRRNLSNTVHAFRGDCRRREGEIRFDVLGANRAWNDMAFALKEKQAKRQTGA